MKKVPNSWKALNHIIVFVNHIELHIHQTVQRLIFDCTFENIAKGRCSITIHKESKNNFNEINILSDMALMQINLFVNKNFFEQILETVKVKSVRKPKLKIYPHDGLLINNNSYLYVKENKKVKVRDFEIVVPIS